MSDTESAQSIYDELNRRGVFRDKENAAIGHELRRRGVVKDPTQGGAVAATPATSAKPTTPKRDTKTEWRNYIAASAQSLGTTPELAKKMGSNPAHEAAVTGHEEAQSRARNEAALAATHAAQVYRLHGGGMGYNKQEQAREREAAQQTSAKFQGLRTDPGTLLNQIQPHFDESLAQQGGKKGAVYKKAAGLLNSAPDLAILALTEGAAEIPSIAGQSLLTRGFQGQQIAGLISEAGDKEMREKDPGQYYTSLLLGGLLAGAPDITSHAGKALTRHIEAKKASATTNIHGGSSISAKDAALQDVAAKALADRKARNERTNKATAKANAVKSIPRLRVNNETIKPKVEAKTPVEAPSVPQVEPKVEVNPVEAPKSTSITPEHVKAAAKDGFTKAADLYREAKKTEPKLTKTEFAQRLYEFHKGDTHNYEGPSGNAKPADIFTAKDADGKPIRYFGFSEKTSAKSVEAPPAVVQPPKPEAPKETAFKPAPPKAEDLPKKPTVTDGHNTTNARAQQVRQSMGLVDLPHAQKQAWAGVVEHVEKTGMDRDAGTVADRVLKGGHAMNTEEVMANNYRQHSIMHEAAELRDQIDEGIKAGQNVDAKKVQVMELEKEFEKLTDATKRTGTLTSQALNIRKATIPKYSYEAATRRIFHADPARPLTEPEKAEIKTQSDIIKKGGKTLADKESNRVSPDEKRSQDAATEAVTKMVKERKATTRAEKITDIKGRREDLIRKFVKSNSQANSGFFNVESLPILKDIALTHIDEGIVKVEALVDAVHESIKEHFPDATKRNVRDALSGYDRDPVARKQSKFAELKTEMRLLSEIEDTQRGVAREKRIATARAKPPRIEALRKQRDELLGKPAAAALRMQEMRMKGLQKRLADVTKRADAGDTLVKPRPPGNASPQEVAIRKQIAAKQKIINDLRAKEKAAAKPPVTPKEAKPVRTQAERRLITQRRALGKQIAEYNRRIAAHDFSKNPKVPTPDHPEISELKRQRDALKAVYDSMKPKTTKAGAVRTPRTPATRLEILERQFKTMKEKNAKGDYGTDPTKTPDTPEEAEMRAKLNAARRERGAMRKAQSATPPKDPLGAYKNQLQKRLDQLNGEINGTYAKGPKPDPRKLDQASEDLKTEIAKAQSKLDAMERNRQPKGFQDRWVAYRRFVALSRLGSISKLGAAASERMIFSPLEEVTGLPARYLMPNIERKAPTHGRPSLRAEAGAVNRYFSRETWTKHAVDKFRTGENYLDAKYGNKDHFEGEYEKPTILNFPGRVHGAIKTPAQVASFERAQIKGTLWAERQGLDVSDPLVQSHIDAMAYQESLRTILMQDNVATDLYKGVVSSLERSKYPAGKVVATAMRSFMPIVKVPTNFAGEVGLHAFGGVRAAWEVAGAKLAGKDLTPEQCDVVLRSLKKNGVGGMMFALGYMNADKLGGEFAPGHKRKESDPEYGAIKIGSFEVPHNILHNPAIEALQIGATFRKIHDEEMKNRVSGHPFLRAAEGSALGAVENIPFIDFPKRAGRAMDSDRNLEKFAGEQAASMALPGFLSEIGAQFNKDKDGKQIKHKPQDFWDEIKMAAGFQSTVPTSAPSRGGSSGPALNPNNPVAIPGGMGVPRLSGM